MKNKSMNDLVKEVVKCLEKNKHFCNYDAIREVSFKNGVSHTHLTLAYSQYKRNYVV